MADGDVGGARTALAPLVEGWDPGEEGPFALSALLPMAAAEVASAGGDTAGADRWSAALTALGSGPRAEYARALADLAHGHAGRRAVERAAGAVERDGRRWEGAWMRIAGACAALRAEDPGQARQLAVAASDGFRAMGAEDWCRRCEELAGARRPPDGAGARGRPASW